MLSEYAQFLKDVDTLPWLAVWKKYNFFKTYELVPENIYKRHGDSALRYFHPDVLMNLLEIRLLADKPMIINTWHMSGSLSNFQYRGYRPISFYPDNTIQEGFLSPHCLCKAFDYNVVGKSCDDHRNDLIQWKREGKLKHLKRIEAGTSSWVHVDTLDIGKPNEDDLIIFSV